MKPIIGIVGRPNQNDSGYSVVACHEYLRNAIIKAGGIPILILPTQDVDYYNSIPRELERLTDSEKEDLVRQINLCDGIVLAGGIKFYEYDLFVCDYIIENDIPTLGICMGMQLMAYYDNIKNNSLPCLEKNETDINHFQMKEKHVHDVLINKGSILYNIYKDERINVNSVHNYHINNLHNMEAIAYSSDGLIEGIVCPDKKFILGLQWHPEAIIDDDNNHINVFKTLIEKSIKG